jgi:hypothetical protein
MNIKSQDDPKLEAATKEIYKKEIHTGVLNETRAMPARRSWRPRWSW